MVEEEVKKKKTENSARQGLHKYIFFDFFPVCIFP